VDAVTTGDVPDVIGVMTRAAGLPRVDLQKVVTQQAILELGAGMTDGPALRRIRAAHHELAIEAGLVEDDL
jgi:hypothetical protein